MCSSQFDSDTSQPTEQTNQIWLIRKLEKKTNQIWLIMKPEKWPQIIQVQTKSWRMRFQQYPPYQITNEDYACGTITILILQLSNYQDRYNNVMFCLFM